VTHAATLKGQLRDLLDHFGGDVEKAIGAYNGGVKTPNPAYASSVKNIADYARRILEHSTAQDDSNAKSKPPDKSQPVVPCKPAASADPQATKSGDAPGASPSRPSANNTGANNCVPATPAAPNATTPGAPAPDSAQKAAPKPKPPYRRTDD